MNTEIAIVGTGPFGRAIISAAIDAGHRPRVWGRSETGRQCVRELFDDRVTLCESLEETCAQAGMICLAIPASGFYDVAMALGAWLMPDQVIVHGTRGVSEGFARSSQILRDVTCVRQIGVLGGVMFRQGNHAKLIGGMLASRFDDVQTTVRAMFHLDAGRLHASDDVIGVELCGVMGHVTEIALGLAEGCALDLSSAGVLAAYGLADAARLGVVLGARRETFHGLAGVGELLPRHGSASGRHRALGKQLGQGIALEDALNTIDGEVEGVMTAREAHAFARSHGVHLPLVEAVVLALDGVDHMADVLRTVLCGELAWS